MFVHSRSTIKVQNFKLTQNANKNTIRTATATSTVHWRWSKGKKKEKKKDKHQWKPKEETAKLLNLYNWPLSTLKSLFQSLWTACFWFIKSMLSICYLKFKKYIKKKKKTTFSIWWNWHWTNIHQKKVEVFFFLIYFNLIK